MQKDSHELYCPILPKLGIQCAAPCPIINFVWSYCVRNGVSFISEPLITDKHSVAKHQVEGQHLAIYLSYQV